MGDSGAGVVTKDFIKESFPNWNAFKHAPKFVPGISGIEGDIASSGLKQIYYFIAKHYPGVNFSQFNFAYDYDRFSFLKLCLKNLKRTLIPRKSSEKG